MNTDSKIINGVGKQQVGDYKKHEVGNVEKTASSRSGEYRIRQDKTGAK